MLKEVSSTEYAEFTIDVYKNMIKKYYSKNNIYFAEDLFGNIVAKIDYNDNMNRKFFINYDLFIDFK